MFRRSRFRWDFRTQPSIGDLPSVVLQRNNLSYDHVAIDVGQFAATALRLCRDLSGPERDLEVSRFLTRNVVSLITKRIRVNKSLALFFDGSDPLWKIRRARKFPSKKSEGRFHRSAASPMSFTIEDKMYKHCLEAMNTVPNEVLISGPGTAGPAESKMAAWMLDLASHVGVGNTVGSPATTVPFAATCAITRTDSFCLIGAKELYLNALAMTPFTNITAMQLDRQEFKGLSLLETIDWLAVGEIYRSENSNTRMARIRTDVTFIMLLTQGLSVTDCPSLPNVQAKDCLEVYLTNFVPKDKWLFEETPPPTDAGSSSSSSSSALQSESTLLLNTKVLGELLAHVLKKTPAARPEIMSADALELCLQTHSMLCLGHIFNYGFATREPLVAQTQPLRPDAFLGHVLSLNGAKVRCSSSTSFAPTQPAFVPSKPGSVPKPSETLATPPLSTTGATGEFALTSAEFLLTCAPEAAWIDQTLPAFTGGHGLLPGMSDALIKITEASECAIKAREILSAVVAGKVSPQDATLDSSESAATPPLLPHRGLIHSPSHYFIRRAGEKGPPSGWAYYSVNLGNKSRGSHTRAKRNLEASSVVIASDVKKKHALVGFVAGTTWTEIDTAIPGNSRRDFLNVVTWNVQFDRFSGQTTPLGKPGIEWCSRQRYVALAKVLEQTDADIIAMQETEPTWWDFLSKQAWVQKQYMFSCNMRGDAITPWGQLMLVNKRLPVTSMSAANVPGYTGHTSVMPTCTIQLTAGKTLTINSVHLLAPYTQSNVNVRVTQLDVLMKRLSPKLVGEDVIVMGDFNDHPSNFFVMPAPMGNFVDAWAQVHGTNDGDNGYTINGRRSKYTALIIEPEFFGRADRMLYKSQHLKAVDASLIGTKSVREELGITTCPDYLFPSDHFGLRTRFEVIQGSGGVPIAPKP